MGNEALPLSPFLLSLRFVYAVGVSSVLPPFGVPLQCPSLVLWLLKVDGGCICWYSMPEGEVMTWHR